MSKSRVNYVYHKKCECGEYLRRKTYSKPFVLPIKFRCRFCENEVEYEPAEFMEEKVLKIEEFTVTEESFVDKYYVHIVIFLMGFVAGMTAIWFNFMFIF